MIGIHLLTGPKYAHSPTEGLTRYTDSQQWMRTERCFPGCKPVQGEQANGEVPDLRPGTDAPADGNEPGLADAAANSELDRSVALTMIRVR